MGIKVTPEQMGLIEMVTGLAIEAAIKWASGYYKQIAEADDEAIKQLNEELHAKRKKNLETIINL